MKDELGKRMKENYESRTKIFLPRRTYTLVRIDGKSFHTYTRGLNKPFDADLVEDMNNTTEYLCRNIQGCKFGYVQSDEISLLLTDFEKDTTDAWFDGQVQKIVSVAASMATSKFNQLRYKRILTLGKSESSDLENFIFDSLDKMPLAQFDARVWTVPDPTEVENYFIWRQKDAVRNSISMLAQSLYSHKELEGKSQSDMQELCFQKGQNWNNINDRFKRGLSFYIESIPIMSADSFDQTVYFNNEWESEPFDFLKERNKLSISIPKYK